MSVNDRCLPGSAGGAGCRRRRSMRRVTLFVNGSPRNGKVRGGEGGVGPSAGSCRPRGGAGRREPAVRPPPASRVIPPAFPSPQPPGSRWQGRRGAAVPVFRLPSLRHGAPAFAAGRGRSSRPPLRAPVPAAGEPGCSRRPLPGPGAAGGGLVRALPRERGGCCSPGSAAGAEGNGRKPPARRWSPLGFIVLASGPAQRRPRGGCRGSAAPSRCRPPPGPSIVFPKLGSLP